MQDFLNQVLSVIQGFGGLSFMLKASAIITLTIASMKVTALNQLIWSKLGSFQAWLAPILGLVAGILSIGSSGPLTLAKIFAYMSAGAGAVVLHELLDTIKAVPGLGAIYVSIINVIEGSVIGSAPNSLKS